MESSWEKEKGGSPCATKGICPKIRGHILFPWFKVLQNPTAKKHEKPPRYRGVLTSLICSIKIWRF